MRSIEYAWTLLHLKRALRNVFLFLAVNQCRVDVDFQKIGDLPRASKAYETYETLHTSLSNSATEIEVYFIVALS